MEIQIYNNVCTSDGVYINGTEISEYSLEEQKHLLMKLFDNGLICLRTAIEHGVAGEGEIEDVECELCGTGEITTYTLPNNKGIGAT